MDRLIPIPGGVLFAGAAAWDLEEIQEEGPNMVAVVAFPRPLQLFDARDIS
jgi:hypothetical protein